MAKNYGNGKNSGKRNRDYENRITKLAYDLGRIQASVDRNANSKVAESYKAGKKGVDRKPKQPLF